MLLMPKREQGKEMRIDLFVCNDEKICDAFMGDVYLSNFFYFVFIDLISGRIFSIKITSQQKGLGPPLKIKVPKNNWEKYFFFFLMHRTI